MLDNSQTDKDLTSKRQIFDKKKKKKMFDK